MNEKLKLWHLISCFDDACLNLTLISLNGFTIDPNLKGLATGVSMRNIIELQSPYQRNVIYIPLCFSFFWKLCICNLLLSTFLFIDYSEQARFAKCYWWNRIDWHIGFTRFAGQSLAFTKGFSFNWWRPEWRSYKTCWYGQTL